MNWLLICGARHNLSKSAHPPNTCLSPIRDTRASLASPDSPRTTCTRLTVHRAAQVLTLTDGPAITSLAVAPGGAYLIAHMVAHTLQLWPLASISSRLQAIAPAESPARMPSAACRETLESLQ